MKINKLEGYTKFQLPDSRDCELFMTDNNLKILKSIDNTEKWGALKHISISHRRRYPTWNEIIQLKNKFFGDVDCMMILPKKENYVNAHKNCFHIWQTPQEWDIR